MGRHMLILLSRQSVRYGLSRIGSNSSVTKKIPLRGSGIKVTKWRRR